jgi:acetyltransferase-like isoleucine patch superfamily enzyme
VAVGQGVRAIGIPLIDARNGGRILIGDGVVLNSRNKGYFGPLFGPVKLFADQPGSVVRIGRGTRIHGSCIHAYCSIDIGENCLIAGNCTIVDADGHTAFPPEIVDRLKVSSSGRPVVLEDNVWLGMNCIVLKGVRIGNGSVVSAGSVVTRDIPPFSVAAGNPAQIVKSFEGRYLDALNGKASG